MIWTWSYPWNKKMVRMAQHAIVPADNLLHPISAEIWSIRQPWKIDCLWYYSTPEVETITLFIGFHISLLTRSNALCYFQAIKSLFLKHSPFLSLVTLQLGEANKKTVFQDQLWLSIASRVPSCNREYNGPKVCPQTFRFQEMENNDEDDTGLINDNG